MHDSQKEGTWHIQTCLLLAKEILPSGYFSKMHPPHSHPTPPLPSPSLDLRVCPWFQQLDLTVYYCCEVVSCAGTVPVLCVAVANTKRPCHEYLNWNMQWLCSGVKIQPIIWIQTQIYMVVCRLQIRLFFVCFVVVFNINFCWCNLMTPVVSMVIVRSV